MSAAHENLKLVGIHEPEYSTDPGPDGNKIQVKLPGYYTIGVEVEGAFVQLARFPAGNLLRDIERAKKNAPAATPQPETPSQPSQPETPHAPTSGDTTTQ